MPCNGRSKRAKNGCCQAENNMLIDSNIIHLCCPAKLYYTTTIHCHLCTCGFWGKLCRSIGLSWLESSRKATLYRIFRGGYRFTDLATCTRRSCQIATTAQNDIRRCFHCSYLPGSWLNTGDTQYQKLSLDRWAENVRPIGRQRNTAQR